jgi:tungstate transport system substrate-binding protein
MKSLKVFAFVCMFFTLCLSHAGANEKIIKMATTTSTQDSGLLDILLPECAKDTGIQVKVIAKGTGAAIREAIDGNVDVVFVHDQAKEEAFVKEGYGTKRYAVMHNDFVLVGPESDKAHVKGAVNTLIALKKIAKVKANFISRGDDSGTHVKEQDLWKASGLALATNKSIMDKEGKQVEVQSVQPANSSDWYFSVGQGMGKVLTLADEKQAYTLADRGTYIKYTTGRDMPIQLAILVEGGAALANPYGVIPVNPQKHPHVHYDVADQFAQWLVSPRAQQLIADYKLHGKQLFFPDAVAAKK